ncbi:MAG: hypothetical protein IJP50_07215 [Paludibacteraceae bacterium]|nr:hypothetical protein [Paludibacteraceae bacterium]MDY6373078.1 tetratricopeptide repeat protein [Bacteroidales bacterium]
MISKSAFLNYIKHPEQLDVNSLPAIKDLVQQYPYFQAARMLYIRNLKNTDDLSYHAELKKGAINVPDRVRLEQIMNKAASEKKEQSTVTVVADDANIESVPQLKHHDLIDNFITANPHIKPVGEVSDVETVVLDNTNVTDSIFTESLAKIYIKQGQYDKAIRIFEKLNLKYPEKSSYFADQIRFLKKIIENR